MRNPERWEIRLPAYLPNEKAPVVIRNGEDISEEIRSITIRAEVGGVTTVEVEYLMAEVDMEASAFPEETE